MLLYRIFFKVKYFLYPYFLFYSLLLPMQNSVEPVGDRKLFYHLLNCAISNNFKKTSFTLILHVALVLLVKY